MKCRGQEMVSARASALVAYVLTCLSLCLCRCPRKIEGLIKLMLVPMPHRFTANFPCACGHLGLITNHCPGNE